MPPLRLGLVHTPLTPFAGDISVDLDRYARIIAFHLDNGAQALALPMHVGESVGLSDAERRALLEFALARVDGRVPVLAHVTQSGTDTTRALAVHAEQAGAAAVICTTPYYWKPQPEMLLRHLADIGAAVRIPYFLYNAPGEMGGTRITTALVLALIERLPNFAGVVDVSLDWQFLIEVVSSARNVKPDFQVVSGLEFLISAGAVGAKGAFAPHATIAPRLVARLYELCRTERYRDARPAQEEIARLYRAIRGRGAAGMKAAVRAMRRDCGEPRPPILPLGEAAQRALADEILRIRSIADEPKGW